MKLKRPFPSPGHIPLLGITDPLLGDVSGHTFGLQVTIGLYPLQLVQCPLQNDLLKHSSDHAVSHEKPLLAP
jgi:hypothetical protein